MTLQHEKSSCCQGEVIRFGGRRRQCIVCRRTWRVWPRARGRDKKRINQTLLAQFLDGNFVSIQREARRRRIHESALRRQLVIAAEQYNAKPWGVLAFDEGSLVLMADAVIKRIGYRWWTVYFVAIKLPRTSAAVLLAPTIISGRESYAGWQSVLNAIPDDIHANTKALVCDGHIGLVHYARWSGWHVQRCQAHLLFSIAGRRSRSPWSRHRDEGEELYKLAKIVLSETDEKTLIEACIAVEVMGWETSSRQLSKIISGFMKSIDDYRTYLVYPELDIPKTNNPMESFISQFQELCHRSRGFATVKAISRWAAAFTKHKKHITCNGSHQPN